MYSESRAYLATSWGFKRPFRGTLHEYRFTQVTCTVLRTKKRKTIPVIVRVSDLNDNSPQFQNIPYEISLPEKTLVGTAVFDGLAAVDVDAGTNGLVEYSIVPGDGSPNDGFGYFTINLPHQVNDRLAKYKR